MITPDNFYSVPCTKVNGAIFLEAKSNKTYQNRLFRSCSKSVLSVRSFYKIVLVLGYGVLCVQKNCKIAQGLE